MPEQPMTVPDMFDQTKWGEDFSREEIERISKHMTVQDYAKGEYVFRENDARNYLAFIIKGRVDIVKEGPDELEQAVITLKAGTHFGEMAFVDGRPRSASAMARDDVTLLTLSPANFERILAESPDVGVKMLKKIATLLSRRLRLTTGRLICSQG